MFVHCPHCLKRYRLPTGYKAILRVKCRGCGREFIVEPSKDASHEISGDGRHAAIVVADIQREFRNYLIGILNRQGFALSVVENGSRAYEITKKKHPGLLLVNAYLPGLLGVDVIDRLRKESEKAPAIILLGAIHNVNRYRRRPESLYGADDYLDEGASEAVILRKLEFYLRTPITLEKARNGVDREALRLARSVFTDMLVYNPGKLSKIKAPEDFFRVFQQESAEAKRFLEDTKAGAGALLNDVVANYLDRN